MRSPTTEEFVDALNYAPLTALQRSSILGLYSFPNHRGTAPQLARLLNGDKNPLQEIQRKLPPKTADKRNLAAKANLSFGGAGHVISDYLNILPVEWQENDPNWWSILSTWDSSNRMWCLLPELIEAIEKSEGEDAFSEIKLPDEVPPDNILHEGATKCVTVLLYERNPLARKKCIEHYGCSCTLCGFNFENNFGSIGRNYIHVHHKVPLADISKEYEVDPINDLIPVCPNCHAMLHQRTPPFTIEELEEIIISNQRVESQAGLKLKGNK